MTPTVFINSSPSPFSGTDSLLLVGNLFLVLQGWLALFDSTSLGLWLSNLTNQSTSFRATGIGSGCTCDAHAANEVPPSDFSGRVVQLIEISLGLIMSTFPPIWRWSVGEINRERKIASCQYCLSLDTVMPDSSLEHLYYMSQYILLNPLNPFGIDLWHLRAEQVLTCTLLFCSLLFSTFSTMSTYHM